MESPHKIPQSINTGTETGSQEKPRLVKKKDLINILNYFNFQDRTVLINLKHVKNNRTISCRAKPQPCFGDQLDCLWAEDAKFYQNLNLYKFQNILVNDGLKLILIESELISISVNGISILIPETCSEINSRKAIRHLCKDINIQLIQNSALFYGSLIDFSAFSFRVKVRMVPPQTDQWIDSDSPVTIIFYNNAETLYSGECNILKLICGNSHKTVNLVLKPLNNQLHRFKPKKFRSMRQELTPSPDIVFKHPLTRKMIFLKAGDLSGSGFSVQESQENAVLLPGMIIPRLELVFANSFKVNCKAQVVYGKINDNDKEDRYVKCGLAFLDIDTEDHMRMLALMHQAADSNSYICNKVDPDALWNFFFKTGFIYPKKYAFIKTNKEKIKKTYEKLYTLDQNIARNFIFQDKGRILGHMATLRFYENSWLIHHHASDISESKTAGLVVLNQIGRFINDSHSLYSIHMNFIFCYFRPGNKFPNSVFGGIARKIRDPKGCSLDTFAYFHFCRSANVESDMPKSWELTKTGPEDLMDLETFYEHESGGLMFNALDFGPGMVDCNELSKEYKRLGLKREKHLFSLKMDGSLKAVILADISDIGLNLSDLTNSVKIIVVDQGGLSRNIFNLMLSELSKKLLQEEITVLLYPLSYAENQSILYEKLYNIWVLNTKNTDDYFLHLKRLFRFIQH
jgi:hypothetical protein